MKKKIFCVPRVFVSNVTNDFVKDQKKTFRELMTLTLKEVAIAALGFVVLGGITFVLVTYFEKIHNFMLLFCLLPLFLFGILAWIWYLITAWKKAKDECFDILKDE